MRSIVVSLWLAVTLVLCVRPAVASPAADADSPVKIAQIVTPSSNSAAAWNRSYLAIALFEQISPDVAIDVIRRDHEQVRRIIVPNAYIVYSMFFDATDIDVLWVLTSKRAALFRVALASGTVEEVARFGDANFIFAGEQHPSGDIYLGTYPDAKLYRVSRSANGYDAWQLQIPAELIGGRTNVKDIFAPPSGYVFFHVGSPGTLIAYDPASGRAATILDSTESFLYPRRDVIQPIEVVKSLNDFHVRPLDSDSGYSRGPLPDWARKLADRDVFTVDIVNFEAIVRHDGRETRLSVRPRHGGMPITAFKAVSPSLAVGATYWNRWFFQVDLDSGAATPLGAIGRTGEFFTACSTGHEVVIPHYLGLLLEWDPDAPLQLPKPLPAGLAPETISVTSGDNPRELLVRPDAHVGLDCLDVGSGQIVYTTLPTYGQETGRLWRVAMPSRVRAAAQVLADRTPPQTVARLAMLDGRLYAGTSEFRGLGLQRLANPPRPRIIELDTQTLEEIRSVELPVDQHRNTTGLVPLRKGRLMAGTEGGGLWLIDTADEHLEVRHIAPVCQGVNSLKRLDDDRAVVLCGERLYVADSRYDAIAEAAVLPSTANYLVVGADNSVLVTSNSDLIRVPKAAIKRAAWHAAASVAPGRLIADGEAGVYRLGNILARDRAAWISPLNRAEALDRAYVGMDFGTRTEEIVGAEVVWVLSANTPEAARFEYSDDGTDWHVAATIPTAPGGPAPYWSDSFGWSSVGAHRFWRVRPAGQLADQFGMEYLEFHRFVATQLN